MSDELIFNEMAARLSAVPRWSIVHTIQKQSVAEHSYNVAVMTMNIAEKWLKWGAAKTLDAVSYALTHDALEAVTGDPPSPVSNDYDKHGIATKYYALFIHRGVQLENAEDVMLVVKMADLLEAWQFCKREQAMGNKSVDRIQQQIWGKIGDVTKKFPEKLGVDVTMFVRKFAIEMDMATAYQNPHD